MKFRALCLGFTLLTVAAAVESSSTQASAWPLPDRCAEVYPKDCNDCCVSTGNKLGQWCYNNTKPGPEREECHDGVVTWFTMCVEACKGKPQGS